MKRQFVKIEKCTDYFEATRNEIADTIRTARRERTTLHIIHHCNGYRGYNCGNVTFMPRRPYHDTLILAHKLKTDK